MTPFSISALHILSECDIVLRKNLKEEWYFFNSRVKRRGIFWEVVPEEIIMEEFYGKNISISAIVGTNGSGKSSVLELIYRIINNLSAILERGKRRSEFRGTGSFIRSDYCWRENPDMKK